MSACLTEIPPEKAFVDRKDERVVPFESLAELLVPEETSFTNTHVVSPPSKIAGLPFMASSIKSKAFLRP